MTEPGSIFEDLERVSHEVRGQGRVCFDPARLGLVVTDDEPSTVDCLSTVYVIWDDDRYPVDRVPRDELQKVPTAAIAISSGY